LKSIFCNDLGPAAKASPAPESGGDCPDVSIVHTFHATRSS
jgi:hypothetical protein